MMLLVALVLLGLVPAESIAIAIGVVTMVPGVLALVRVSRIEPKVDAMAKELLNRGAEGGGDEAG